MFVCKTQHEITEAILVYHRPELSLLFRGGGIRTWCHPGSIKSDCLMAVSERSATEQQLELRACPDGKIGLCACSTRFSPRLGKTKGIRLNQFLKLYSLLHVESCKLRHFGSRRVTRQGELMSHQKGSRQKWRRGSPLWRTGIMGEKEKYDNFSLP